MKKIIIHSENIKAIEFLNKLNIINLSLEEKLKIKMNKQPINGKIVTPEMTIEFKGPDIVKEKKYYTCQIIKTKTILHESIATPIAFQIIQKNGDTRFIIMEKMIRKAKIIMNSAIRFGNEIDLGNIKFPFE